MSQPVWIFGAHGQIGRHLTELYQGSARAFSSAELNFSDENFAEQLARLLREETPSLVINMAAYTDVNGAESDPKLAHAINADAVRMICDALAPSDIPLIHGSTDYVFSGHSDSPYLEDAATHPINAYGKSKRAGEDAVCAYGHGVVLRYSWVYDDTRRNFFTIIRELMRTQRSIRVVADQIGAPSYAGDVAMLTLHMAQKILSNKRPQAGIYHATPRGHTSWHGFACAIADGLRAQGEKLALREIEPIISAEYKTTAARPLNSRLNTQKIQALGIELPHWQEGLARCLRASKNAL